MVNGLFNFDLEKKNVIIKDNIEWENQQKPGIIKKLVFQEIKKDDIEEIDDNKYEDDVQVVNIRKNFNHRSTKTLASDRKMSRNDLMYSNLDKAKTKDTKKHVKIISRKESNTSNSKEFNRKKKIINKVRLNRACVYFCFCFVRRSKNLENVLINEGMDLISKRLDIFNIFEKMYKDEHRDEPLLNKIFSMSDECKTGLRTIRLDTSGSRSSKSSKSSIS